MGKKRQDDQTLDHLVRVAESTADIIKHLEQRIVQLENQVATLIDAHYAPRTLQ